MEDQRFPLQPLSYGTLSQNMSKMQTVLPRLKYFFAHIKFHSDCGRAIGKIKQNEQDCRDTAPLRVLIALQLRKDSSLMSFDLVHYRDNIFQRKLTYR